MRVISNWTSKRAGAAMTIHGEEIASGVTPVKLTNIVSITGGRQQANSTGERGPVIATGRDGAQYRLI